jgi:hypothetical protein
MAYSFDQFCRDAHDALKADPGRGGKEMIRSQLEKLLQNEDFVAETCGPQAEIGVHQLYRDPDLDFVVLAHINDAPRTSPPHDHGSSWAIYGQGLAGIGEIATFGAAYMLVVLIEPLVDLAVDKLAPISTEMARLMQDPAEIDRILGQGATRARAIGLLAQEGVSVTEKTLSVADFLGADEVFSTGNHSKIVPVTQVEDRAMQPGPIAKKARQLYWDWAHSMPA